jgi:hypothetical protein
MAISNTGFLAVPKGFNNDQRHFIEKMWMRGTVLVIENEM